MADAKTYTKSEQKGAGSKAAKIFKVVGKSGGSLNIITDYYWTLSPKESRKETPQITLTEYEVNESVIKRSLEFYAGGVGGMITEKNNILAPYEQIFPYDIPTGNYFVMPYFSDINYDVSTPQWASLDTVGAVKSITQGIGSIAFGDLGRSIVDGIWQAGKVAASTFYPKVGIMDRPKLWESHDFRSYTVKFPLINTFNPDPGDPEWKRNREFCEIIINNNLYNKTSFATGIPPVFYKVEIPGQHYSPASCVTNITINNRGNIRLLDGYNVPDVYEVNITLTDLVIPSKNLFQAINDNKVVEAFEESKSIITEVAETAANTIETVRDLGETTTPTAPVVQPPDPRAPLVPGVPPSFVPPCWVAREVYGTTSIKWIIFRDWLYGETGPGWLQKIYTKHGEKFAKFISNKPAIKYFTKILMDIVVNKRK